MKKLAWIALLLAFCCLLPLFVGCQSESDADATESTEDKALDTADTEETLTDKIGRAHV